MQATEPKRRGRPPGIKEVAPRPPRVITVMERKALTLTATETAVAAITPKLDGVIKVVAQKALEGDMQAAGLLLRYGVPIVPKTVARGLEDIAHLPVDQRVAEIARRAAAGEIDLESASVLATLAKNEVEARIIAPVKAALMALKAGEQAAVVLQKLAQAVDELPMLHEQAPAVIAHSPVVHEETFDDIV